MMADSIGTILEEQQQQQQQKHEGDVVLTTQQEQEGKEEEQQQQQPLHVHQKATHQNYARNCIGGRCGGVGTSIRGSVLIPIRIDCAVYGDHNNNNNNNGGIIVGGDAAATQHNRVTATTNHNHNVSNHQQLRIMDTILLDPTVYPIPLNYTSKEHLDESIEKNARYLAYQCIADAEVSGTSCTSTTTNTNTNMNTNSFMTTTTTSGGINSSNSRPPTPAFPTKNGSYALQPLSSTSSAIVPMTKTTTTGTFVGVQPSQPQIPPLLIPAGSTGGLNAIVGRVDLFTWDLLERIQQSIREQIQTIVQKQYYSGNNSHRIMKKWIEQQEQKQRKKRGHNNKQQSFEETDMQNDNDDNNDLVRKKIKQSNDSSNENGGSDTPTTTDSCKTPNSISLSHLIPIQLRLDVYGIRVHDDFLWDTSNLLLNPMEMAYSIGIDLQLPDHVIQVIAIDIAEQIQKHQRNGGTSGSDGTNMQKIESSRTQQQQQQSGGGLDYKNQKENSDLEPSIMTMKELIEQEKEGGPNISEINTTTCAWYMDPKIHSMNIGYLATISQQQQSSSS